MSGERYTQIKRPVSRLTEKLLGWISWIFLLILTVITMFIALVSFSNDTSIQNLENSMNNNQLIQQILANNSLNTTQFVIWLQNGIWAIIVYFIICLLISFLALISMNIRILSGILFLIASIITLPLVLLFITLIIPIFFFITAIMMFARRSKVESVPAYGPTYDYPPYYNQRDDYDEGHYYEEEPVYYNDEEEYIEPPRKAKKLERRTRREQSSYYNERENNYEDYNHLTQNKNEHDFNDDIEEDKYNQYPKRAVTSEYQQSSNDDDNSGVLSRQRKYKYNSKNNIPNEVNDDENVFNENNVETDSYIDKKEQKAQRKKEKAELRAKKKEKRKAYNQRMKEKRKNQPSAVNQRRMNYEERKQILNKEENKETHSDDHK